MGTVSFIRRRSDFGPLANEGTGGPGTDPEQIPITGHQRSAWFRRHALQGVPLLVTNAASLLSNRDQAGCDEDQGR